MDFTEDPFVPDWYSSPWETIEELLVARGMSKSDFLQMMRKDDVWAAKLYIGKAAILEDDARRLAELLGGSKQFWLNRQRQFSQDQIRIMQENPLNISIRDDE